MIECAAGYLREAIRRIAAGTRTLEVRSEVADAFDREMQERLGSGERRSVTDWPGTMREYERRTAHFDDTEYLAT
jgi:hypothetical protein